ncbi:hypothetical protein KEH51_21145 [[Brevibacterium] frigoritolerans]|uniref:Uncharacterized protein n=1 Tax=Peribacillus frigoritolerans TaxID=450367 RepID=A0A941J388_9BACI|nr:hypothetical protein [Peribacillus frigoritolerans]
MIGSGVRDSCGSAWGNVQFVQAKRTVGKIDLYRILSAAEASILDDVFFDIKFYLRFGDFHGFDYCRIQFFDG